MGNVTSSVVSQRNVGFMKFIWLLVVFMGLSVSGWGQITIVSNGAEVSGTTWGTSTNTFNASNTNTGTPSERVKTGTQSFQNSNTSMSLITNSASTVGYTNCFVELWNASISGTTGNGIDTGEGINIYVSNTSTFSSTPDVTIVSSTANVRWGMSGTGVITTTAGTPVTQTYSSGGTLTAANAYSKVIINIPNNWTTVFLKVTSTTNSADEIICIDDISLKGTIISSNPTKLAITSISPSIPTAGSNFNVTIQAQDGSSVAGNVSANTAVSLSNTGGGTIGGTTTGTITAGSNSVTISGVTLSTSGTGVTLTATSTGGDALTAGTSSTFNVLAIVPSTASSALVFGSQTTTTIPLTSWTTGNGTNRIVVRRAGGSATAPTNGTDYAVSATLGTGTVIYNGSSNNVTASSLTAGTQYSIDIYEYNGSGATANYGSVYTANRYTLSDEPGSHSATLTASSIASTTLTLNFTTSSATLGYLIVRKDGAAAFSGTPIDGTGYTAGNTIGDGTVAAVVTTTTTTASITGLTAATQYTFSIIPFGRNSTNTESYNYYTGGTIPTLTVSTLATAPTAPTALTFGSVTYNSFTTSFTAPGTAPTGYLVLRRSSSAVTGTPVAGIAYIEGQTNIGSSNNEVVYVGSSAWSTYAQSGLTDNTTYYYAVYSYNGSGANTNYSATSLTGSQKTSVILATTANTATNISSTGFTVNWESVAGANGYKLDVYSSGVQTLFSENFNSFTGSGFAPTPAAGQLSSNVWSITGWSDGNMNFGDTKTTANNDYSRGASTGGVTTGGIYSFEVSTDNKTLGIQPGGSDWAPGSIVLKITNSTDKAIKNIEVSYKLYVRNDQGRSSSFNLAYSTNNTDFIAVPSCDFTSGAAADASPSWVVNNFSATITDLNIANNGNFYLQWNGADVGGSGSRDEFALDDIELNVLNYVTGYDNLAVSGSNYVISGLSPNTTYNYRVRTVGGNSNGLNSNVVSITTSQVSTPTASVATNVTSSSFTANTNTVSDATGYVVDLAYDEAFTNIVSFYNGMTMSGTTRIFNGLTPNTTYYYRVRTTSPNSTSANSNIISVTTLASYAISLSAGANGSITSGAGNYDAGTSVTVVASPASGYRFLNWTEGGSPVSTSASYSFTASAARTLVANFASNAVEVSVGTTNASALVNCTNCDVTVPSGAELNVNSSTTLNSLTVAPGGKVTLRDGFSLSAPITLQSNGSGTATFVDYRTDESLSAINGVVEQRLPTGRNWYVGLPLDKTDVPYSSLTAAGAGSVSYWSEPAGAWVNNYTGNLTSGVGYIAVSNSGSATTNISLGGKLRSGALIVPMTRTVSASKAGFNLIANPYPSYLNVMQAINTNAQVQKTIWYRTKGTSYQFETVNTTSGVGTNISNTGEVKGYVPPMQAFWVRVLPNASQPTENVSTSITFTNAMRYHANPTVSSVTIPTTPLKAPSNTDAVDQLLRLQVSKGVESDETVVYFNPNAATGFDAYDSPKWSNANPAIPELYTIASAETLAINGLPELVYNTELPLGLYAGTQSVYSIRAKELRNFDSSTRVILKDGAIEYDLTNGDAYEFNSAAYNSTNRFSIIFRSAGTATGVNQASLSNKTNVYVNANGAIIVQTSAALMPTARVMVHNALGQLLSNQLLTTQGARLENVASSPGIYTVTVRNNGENITRKVVVR